MIGMVRDPRRLRGLFKCDTSAIHRSDLANDGFDAMGRKMVRAFWRGDAVGARCFGETDADRRRSRWDC